MKSLFRALTIFLCANICALPVYAVDKRCDYPQYRLDNPDKCETSENSGSFWGILLGGTALAGAGVALVAMGSGGDDASQKPATYSARTLTTQIYNDVGFTDPETLSAVLSDKEYGRNFAHYNEVRLAYSLARGFTGKNANIAVLDTADYAWHGNAVAHVVGNVIAPDATVNPYKVVNTRGEFLSYYEIGNVISSATDANIFNASWGITTANNLNAASIKNKNQLINVTSANFVQSLVDAANRDAIFVWAAGNDSTKQSTALAAAPLVVPELQGHIVNVVAWDSETGALADYSNQCGVTMQYCITAPGTRIDTGKYTASGTSFAAPMVSGAIAVIQEAFPYMQATEITQLLFVTARDLGFDGVDEVYGWGMLDLERATRPVGAALVPLSDGMQPLRTATAGGTVARQLKSADLEFSFFDSFGRAFKTKLNDNVKYIDKPRAFDRLRSDEPRVTVNVGKMEFGFSNENLLVGNGFLQTDQDSLTSFAGLSNEFNLGNVSFFQYARIGFTAPGTSDDSFISKFSNVYSASAKFGAKWQDWTASVAIPESIVGGDMTLRLPSGRSANGQIEFTDHKIGLAENPALEYSLGYKYLTASYIDNPSGRDEYFIMAKTKIAF